MAVAELLHGQGRVPSSAAMRLCGAIPVCRNALELDPERLDEGARVLQSRAGLPVTGLDWVPDAQRSTRWPAASVEMETGTGKTYVFIRSALELARHHGLRKFVIVVPSVAIREGVLKTLQVTREHLGALYPELPYAFFEYDRARPSGLDRFVRSAAVQLMVVTIDAFNKDRNVMRRPSDRFAGQAPIDLVRATRPVLILDEPHNLQSPLRVQALSDLHPALGLRFGATHRQTQGIIHRLTPAQAHRRGLVKTIEVVGDLPGDDSLEAMSARIRATVQAHLQRQRQLATRGIKVLSLFFVDKVASYVGPEPVVRRLFDQHFEALAVGHPVLGDLRAEQVRAAYFAQQRKRAIDSRSGASAADQEAYRLIMRDKERLLDLTEPVSFVFTHSALREGWDNPNIFQICTLSASHSVTKKRQEIGRGVRLCVDTTGERVLDRQVNVLRVFAHESYEAYVGALQSEWAHSFEREAMPPVPRAVDANRGGPARPSEDPQRTSDSELDVERLISETHAYLAGADACRGERGEVSLDVIDQIAESLRHMEPPLPLRRRTILDLVAALAGPEGSLPEGGLLVASVVQALARALRNQVNG